MPEPTDPKMKPETRTTMDDENRKGGELVQEENSRDPLQGQGQSDEPAQRVKLVAEGPYGWILSIDGKKVEAKKDLELHCPRCDAEQAVSSSFGVETAEEREKPLARNVTNNENSDNETGVGR